MTNFIKKIIATLALGMVLTTPALAAECEHGTKAQQQEALAEVEGVQVVKLDDTLVKALIEKKGPPPNGTEGVPFEMELASKGDIGMIMVYQNECFINRIGPAPKQMLMNLLGLSEG
jgi:hypothetical protein